MNAYLDSHLNVNLHLVSLTEKCPENKLSRVGVGGWLEKLIIRLSQPGGFLYHKFDIVT